MLNTVYQLKRPRQFEAIFKEIDLSNDQVLVRPTYLSICNADQRYYQGTRDKKVLNQKLPMALIHEGIGKVVYDPTGTFRGGDQVIMIPNIPEEEDPIVEENYLSSSHFCASGEDGFMRELVSVRPDRLLNLPDGMNLLVASFTELVSVAYHAICRFDRSAHSRRRQIGVWGDGNLAYITALLLKKLFNNCQILVFGKHWQKMADFTFADECYEITEIPDGIKVDHAFECVGGTGAAGAINQIIDQIRPNGTISIMGVTEELAPVNTRMILEKGLTVKGSSRSGRKDYEGLLCLYEREPDMIEYLEKIVGAQIRIRSIHDIIKAFETDIHKIYGKTILIWDK